MGGKNEKQLFKLQVSTWKHKNASQVRKITCGVPQESVWGSGYFTDNYTFSMYEVCLLIIQVHLFYSYNENHFLISEKELIKLKIYIFNPRESRNSFLRGFKFNYTFFC